MPKESKSLRLSRASLSKMAQQIKEKLNNSGGGNEIEVSGASENEDEPLALLASRLVAQGKRRRGHSAAGRSSFAARMADRLQQRMRTPAVHDPLHNPLHDPISLDIDVDAEQSRVREPFVSADTCVDSSVVTFPSPVPMAATVETERMTYSNRRRRASSASEEDEEQRTGERSNSPT